MIDLKSGIWRCLGCPKGQVRIVPYRWEWAWLFEAVAAEIQSACDGRLARIEHIGSTAVPGLAAKPILDIMPGIATPAEGEALVTPMTRLGFEYRGENGIPGRFFFVMDRDDDRVVHAHAFIVDSPEWVRHLEFRDRLRNHPEEARAYESLKRELARRFGNDREAYTETKGGFIDRLIPRDPGRPRA